MSKERAAFADLSATALLQRLAGGAGTAALEVGPGDLSVRQASVRGERVIFVCFDYAVNQGSIGVREADQLVAAIRLARGAGVRVAFLLETSGIRVTDSTAGIASLRRVLREAVDARLAGTRMLAMVLKSTFGGASMLASVCERRVIHADCLFSMSGPRLIEPGDGSDTFFASDRDQVRALLGGEARAHTSRQFVLVDPMLDAYERALAEWLERPTPRPLTLQQLAKETAELERRLGTSLIASSTDAGLQDLSADAHEVLRDTFPEGFVCGRRGHVLLADATGSPTRAIALSHRSGATATDALVLAQELARPRLLGERHDRCVLLLDAESHSSRAADERVVLSEYLAHLALITRALVREGEVVEMVVVAHGGGGIQAALGSAASSVAMTPHARLFVLPPAGMQAIGKAEEPGAGLLPIAISVSAVDQPFRVRNPPMPYQGNFYELFARRVREDAAAACILTDAEGTLTRSWLDAASARYANALVSLDCVPGDRVAVQVEKSAHALALYLGCLRAGLGFVPLNSAYRAAELSDLLEDCRPRVFVTSSQEVAAPDAVQRLTLDVAGGGTLGALADSCQREFATLACSGEETAALLYTSGTTGRPKGAMLSHRAMSYAALALGEEWRFTQSDVLLHALPLFHGHGLFISSNTALAAGATLLFQEKFSVPAVLETLPRVTVFMGVPTYYHRLLADAGLTQERCLNVRLFTCGSAPLSAEMHREFARRTGHQIVERYGATETMILCSNPLDGDRRPGSVGFPLLGVDLRIADKSDIALPAGEIGMIQVRGPGLFSGYWMKPEQTREEFTSDGYFRTGDLGRIGEGGYVWITGRSKDLIISGGYNVYPAEVEAALDEMPSVRESAVVGRPHADFGEAVVAFVIPADSAFPPEARDVVQWARQRLANFKVPKQVVVVDELPRNVMGKVLKNQLRASLAADQ